MAQHSRQGSAPTAGAPATAEHLERLMREVPENEYDLIFGDPLDTMGIEGVGSPWRSRDILEHSGTRARRAQSRF